MTRVPMLIGLLLLPACSAPPRTYPARLAYLACPQTVTLGAFVPKDHIRSDNTLLSFSATWQLRPFLPPKQPPSFFP